MAPKARTFTLSHYLVRVGVPEANVDSVASEFYDTQFGELGIARGAWTRAQFCEAMRLQAIDRNDRTAATRWAAAWSQEVSRSAMARVERLSERLAASGAHS